MRGQACSATFILLTLLGAACTRPSPEAPASSGAPVAKAKPGEKPLSELDVVYAGDAGSARTASFRDFLASHVHDVEVLDVLELAKADVAGADVLIVDGEAIERKGKDISIRPAPKGVTLDVLAVPTVLIGGIGGHVSDSLELKLSWRHG